MNQVICIDIIHSWTTTILEYAIPEYEIIFNLVDNQINIITGHQYRSILYKGTNKHEIEVPDKFINDILMMIRCKQNIITQLENMYPEIKYCGESYGQPCAISCNKCPHNPYKKDNKQ
jgi:hypothetical protein